MSNSVVPAAAVAHAKQLVKNKKLIKRTEEQRPAHDEQQPVHHDQDAANAVQVENSDNAQASMSSTSMSGDFSFSGALSVAADSASFASTSAQDDGGSVGSDGDGAGGTILLVGAVGLAGLGVAVLAGGGGGSKNEAPDITSGSTATVAENAAAATVVYQTVATDADGDNLVYSLSGADASLLNISTTGAVTLKAPADFEGKNSYSFNVVASDGELNDTQAVTLAVTNVTGANGDKPIFTSGTTASIAENSATTATVYDANVTGAGATFALTGQDATAFNIDSATGIVTFKNSPNFEVKNSYSIGVIATQDGGTQTQNVSVAITDVSPEPGPNITSGTVAALNENVAANSIVYDADATGNGTVTFGLTGDDAGAFNIDSSTGVVTIKASPDFETKATYSFSVTAADSNGTTAKALTLSINDLAEVPGTNLDGLGNPNIDNGAQTIDAANGARTFNEGDGATNVFITNFGEDDKVVLVDADALTRYFYTTGTGADATDLIINRTTPAGVASIIVLDDVLSDTDVFNYATARASVGFDFIQLG